MSQCFSTEHGYAGLSALFALTTSIPATAVLASAYRNVFNKYAPSNITLADKTSLVQFVILAILALSMLAVFLDQDANADPKVLDQKERDHAIASITMMVLVIFGCLAAAVARWKGDINDEMTQTKGWLIMLGAALSLIAGGLMADVTTRLVCKPQQQQQ